MDVYFGTDDFDEYDEDDDEADDFDDEDEDIPVIVALDRKLDIDIGDVFTVRDHGEIGEGYVVKIIE